MKSLAQDVMSTPVRDSVRRIIPSLKYVRIDENAIERLVSKFATEEFELPDWRDDVFIDDPKPNTDVSREDVVDFFFVGNTINFQFRDYESGGKFCASYDGTDWSGAYGMWACIRRALERGEDILEGSYLASLDNDDLQRIFEPSNGINIPMLEERRKILNSVGKTLDDRHGGRFSKFLTSFPNRVFDDGNGMVERLIGEFPSFDDTAEVTIDDAQFEVHFYKRAQLAPAMVYGRFADSDYFTLQDPESFTVFADYNLPNILRWYGVLQYDEEIEKKIDRGDLIPKYSRVETELRAATILAADEIIIRVNESADRSVNGAHMDNKLFNMRDIVDTPIHHTKTTAY